MKSKIDFFISKIVIDAKKWRSMEITVDTVENMFTSHIFYIVKPDLDEKFIKSQVTKKYQKMLEESIFSDEHRKQMDKEIKQAIEAEKERISKLPPSIMFEADIRKMENKDQTVMILSMPKDWLIPYLYNNWAFLPQMKLIIGDPYTTFISTDDHLDYVAKLKKDDPSAISFWIFAVHEAANLKK